MEEKRKEAFVEITEGKPRLMVTLYVCGTLVCSPAFDLFSPLSRLSAITKTVMQMSSHLSFP